MKLQRLVILTLSILLSITLYGQLFHPLCLGIETPGEMVADFQPQIHVEGDILFVCTKQGLYSKDLSNDESVWQLAGFEGVPILDFVRRGNDIFALCFNNQNDIFLLSHDGGKTYEDVTPNDFSYFINKEGHVFWYYDQHPTDPNTFLLTSFQDAGIFLTSDFGQTWNKLSEYTPDYVGFHTLNPKIIYECGGGGYSDEKTGFRISYDGGQTWEDKSSCFPNYNSVFRVAFHPTDTNKWIAGGCRYVFTTNDNGQTWNSQMFNIYEDIDWRYPAYDNENPNIVYVAGGHQTQYMKLMCSTDGGTTWNRPYLESKTTPYEFVFDMKQCGDRLLIYSQSDVYEISKAELLATSKAPVTFTAGQMATIILPTEPDASKGKYYRLDRFEKRQIVFEQELQPRARVPYIIVPSEDFSIDPGTLDLEGCRPDTASITGISFIGTYVSEVLPSLGGDGGGPLYYDIIDTTPDCGFTSSGETGTFLIGALRAYLEVDWDKLTWDDPIDHGGSRVPGEKLDIVLLDHATGINEVESGTSKAESLIYNLAGQRISKPTKGIYIENGQKKVK